MKLVGEIVEEAIEKGEADIVGVSEDTTGVATERVHGILALALAQRAATPYGECLDDAAMRHLVKQLMVCDSQRYTPDGKTIVSVLSNEELTRRF